MSTDRVPRDYIFIDESGDPGVGGNPAYLLIAMQLREETLDRILYGPGEVRCSAIGGRIRRPRW